MLNQIIIKTIPLLPRWLVSRVAGRYIAGETKDSALALAGNLAQRGFTATLDILGEDIVSWDQAETAASAYVDLIVSLESVAIERNISVKLTQIGLRLDPDRAFCELARLLQAAAERDVFVRLDMEDSSLTDLTLDFHQRARELWPRVGTVLQSRLRRTVADARRLAAAGANIRLCKGIYVEPPGIAFQDPAEIRDSFIDALRVLLRDGAHVGIATHDLALIRRSEEEIQRRPQPTASFEFQALLGVPIGSTLERLRSAGYVVRLYVPYGREWYAYSMRRLQENPQLAVAIARGLLKRGRFSTAGG